MRITWAMALGLGCLSLFLTSVQADEPAAKPARDAGKITAAIDQALDKRLTEEKVPASPLAADAEFMRRAYLDLTGRIPTSEQAVAFLDSKDSDKRARLIDQLLDSSNYGRHFAIVWSDLITKRDENNRGLNTAGFKDWLAESFNTNRGWDEIVRDLLTADGPTDKAPQGTFFLANRDMTAIAPAKVVGSTANLFLGVQLQCAECHNHPFIREWKQNDFWGVAAFFSRTRAGGATGLVANRGGGTQTITESASSGNTGRGGFAGFNRGGGTRPPSGATIEIPDPIDPRRRTGKFVKAKFFLSDEPKLEGSGPYRPELAKWLTAKDNPFFAKAAVNRLWAHLFVRGFVNPIEDMHDGNPPSHPELLKLLVTEFTDSGFDLKHLLRAFCNTKAYQRTSSPIKGNEDDTQLFSRTTVKVMNPEVLYDSLTQAMGVSNLGGTTTPSRFGGGAIGRGPQGGGREQFVAFFTTKDESDDATEIGFGIPQYLRLMNSRPFNEGGVVVERLMKDDSSPEKVIEGLFLTTLSRRPEPDEVKKLAAYVAKKKDPKAGYNGVLWVLLNSAEFLCIR